ncbi:hypothetical protein [Streptomyces sp. MST-110588]|uniref:hypothetical protein n=1 Tax=Streptomyces sp. MST-110588 TaxID=2833628 RepID=UPI001F5DBE31|nr:hypothetical protein [Streptomyces sp. MST-110588]UNO42215.1 hypothetical protein KGS77_25195 [Streptomyces sp. MST-110588]
MSTQDQRVGAAVLKRLRLSRGWSLSDMAKALIDTASGLGLPALPGVTSVQRSVARWESATGFSLPGERYQLLLAHVYARTSSGYAVGPGSDFAELLGALSRFGVAERRLAELRTLMMRAGPERGAGLLALLGPTANVSLADALADPGRVDDELVRVLKGAVAAVDAEVGSVPFVRLQLLLSPVVQACQKLLSGAVAPPLLSDLRTTAAQAYKLAARLAFETRDDGASLAFYRAATDVAGRLSAWRRSAVLMSSALVTLYTSGVDGARTIVDAAVRDARSGDSVTVRARAHALQAEIAARSGSRRHAQAALALSWYDMDGDHRGDPSSASFSEDHLRGFEGVCNLFVGDAAAAHDHFERAANALVAPRERIQAAIISTDQALARIRLGAPQDAAALLHHCVDAAAGTGSRVAMLRLRTARDELGPWRHERWAGDLDDHLIAAM